MAVLDHTDTLNNLKRKGFKDAVTKNKDHIRIEFWHENKFTGVRTMFSHNKQDIDDYLITCMSKQVGLTRSKFIDLAKCPLSREEYVKILKQQGIL